VPTYPVNECIPYYENPDDLTCHCSAAVTGKRFVDVSATLSSEDGNLISVAPATAGGKAFGVAARDQAEKGRVITRRKHQIVPVTALGTINAGEEVEVGAGSKATKYTSGVKVARCLATTTDGNDCKVVLYV
jgi:hypothetical protein